MSPRALSVDGESSKSLLRYKSTRAGRWNFRSSGGRKELTDLAAWLVALERYDEAVELGEFMAPQMTFTGDWNLWTFAGCGLAVCAHAAWRVGRIEVSDELFKKSAPHPLFHNGGSFDQPEPGDSKLSLTSAARHLMHSFEAYRRGIDVGRILGDPPQQQLDQVLARLALLVK